jgi:hypothetical protein
VVCGLRLTCDIDCCGRIKIGDGYAIDNCGNDLVVCECTPYDVIAALRAKNYLITEPAHDPCTDKEPSRCKIKQCFYITICYDEVQADFTTPFKTICATGTAAACEPTRIKETVRFDVLDELPRIPTYLDELEERITCCWKVFTEGPLGRALKEFLCGDRPARERECDYCNIFCQLKVLFQHHLRRCPDLYDCTLWDQVCRLYCPTDRRREYECYQESFCKLFELITRYAYDCILGEMIFECPCPPQAQCIVLGSVEVEGGKLLRVCNCPRTYVWSFASFVEVFLATFVGGAACAPEPCLEVADRERTTDEGVEEGRLRREPKEKRERICCTTFDIDCCRFMDLFRERPDFGKLAAAAPIHAIRQVSESLRRGFNFSDPLAFSPEIFKGMNIKEAEELATKLAGHDGRTLLGVNELEDVGEPDPLTAILGYVLKRPGDSLVATQVDQGKIARALPRLQLPGPILRTQDWDGRLREAQGKAAEAIEQVETLRKQLDELNTKLSQFQAASAQQSADPVKPRESKKTQPPKGAN